MNRETVMRLAREAGMHASVGCTDKQGKYHPDVNALSKSVPVEWLEAFSALVLAEHAAQIPDGWQLVPIEPTKEMMMAAVISNNGNAVYRNVAAAALEIEEQIYAEFYSAMLAAAPKEQIDV